MIRENVLKYKKVGFVCSTFNHFSRFLELCELEGIVFSKTLGAARCVESYDDIYEKYTEHLDNKYSSIGLIFYENIHADLYEFQFYSRSYKSFKNYKNWEAIEYIDFSSYIREEKFSILLSE